MRHINIVAPDNGVGLTQDRQIITQLLKSEHQITYSESPKPQSLRARFDCNIFLEVVYPEYLALAGKNILIPNPEWFYPQWKKYLYRFDRIFCKTKDCLELFSQLSNKCVFTSFTSKDRWLYGVKKEKTFAHFAGKSSHKGTKQVIAATEQGKCPKVFLYSNLNTFTVKNSRKIEYNSNRIDDEQFRILQNQHQFHICTSEYEGFGHYINEAKSCGAIIITTNHAPMNELVTNDIGFGAGVDKTYKHNMATLAVPNAETIADCMKYAADMDEELIAELSAKTRRAFLTNDYLFKEKFIREISNILNI